jgi:RNA polymerase sigma-70 factor, ECF subfamily
MRLKFGGGGLRDFEGRGARLGFMVQGKSRCPPDTVKPDGTGSEAAGQVEGALKRALIEEALTRLDREQREVLVALHYRRVPVSELAMHLNIPTGTVNTRALSALRAIHRFLNESPQP